jgi:hypothetical protein
VSDLTFRDGLSLESISSGNVVILARSVEVASIIGDFFSEVGKWIDDFDPSSRGSVAARFSEFASNRVP